MCRQASPTITHHGFLMTCERFQLLDLVYNMVFDDAPIIAKKVWSRQTWSRAWAYDDLYWEMTLRINSGGNIMNLLGNPLKLCNILVFSEA